VRKYDDKYCDQGFEFEFETSDKVFSPRRIDAGTLAMLACVKFEEGWRCLTSAADTALQVSQQRGLQIR
jgi:16S rRNA G1207 methylase RsmC